MDKRRYLEYWGVKICEDVLSEAEIAYLKTLPMDVPGVEWIWGEMDKIWNEYGLDNSRPLSVQSIASFYEHPIWMVNGIFTTVDSASVRHRKAIASYISQHRCGTLADYGGGCGSLSLEIAKGSNVSQITLIEPYPSKWLIDRTAVEKGISIESSLTGSYEAVVVQDVLEHVDDPVRLACELSKATDPGGILIFANCFYPVIQCHLPKTFHLRHTFHWVMRLMGLEYLGRISGAEHAQVFKLKHEPSICRARAAESFSRLLGPALNRLRG